MTKRSREALALAAILVSGAFAGCTAPAEPQEGSLLQTTTASAPSGYIAGDLAVVCGTPCASPVDATSSRPWEPSAALDPRDPNHIVVGNAVFETDAVTGLRSSWLESHATFDGGKTWKTTRMPGGASAGPTHPLAVYNAMGDAMVTILADGTVLYAGLAFIGIANANPLILARRAYTFFVARSTDGGLTYPEVSVVREGSGFLAAAMLPEPAGLAGGGAMWDANDKEWIAVAPDGTLLAAWTEILIIHPPEEPEFRQDMLAALSKDGGKTWSAPALIEKGGGFLGAAPVVLSDGAFAVAYVDILTFDVRVAISKDQGKSWQAKSVGSAAHFPSLAVVRSDGHDRLLLALAGVEESARDTKEQDYRKQSPRLLWSDDTGATWSSPLILDVAEAAGRTVPQVVVDDQGTAYVSFYHARMKGDSTESELRVVALSRGIASPAVTAGASLANANALGDYMGLAAGKDYIMLASTTTRDGQEFDLVMSRLATS